jgi:bacterioferritin
MIGKAERGPTAIEAIKKHKSAYLMAVGGAAYLVSKAIKSAKVLGFADLGMEAIYEFDVVDMPVTVAVDSNGTSAHHHGAEGMAGKDRQDSGRYDESIGEMKHADWLIERIFMLDGLPNLQDLHKLLIGEETKEILECDLKLEQISQSTCKEAIVYCESVRDFISREIFVKILDDTEEHIDWLETQLDLIDKVGIQNYQQSGMGSIES